jgi:hypothetical protein
MKTKTTLSDLYSFPGFRALSKLKGILGDSPARVITLRRRQKKRHALHVAIAKEAVTIRVFTGCGTWIAAEPQFTWSSSTVGFFAAIARP